MLKKRLIGVVTVKDGWAVQSFGYRRYLPLGKPETLVQNLDRWGADEILVQCIDRSAKRLGPDLEVLGKIDRLGCSTPIIYGGGILEPSDAIKVISRGADRVMVDAMLFDAPELIETVARDIGSQAIIAHLSARVSTNGFLAKDYRTLGELLVSEWVRRLPLEWISELMITDWRHEGLPESFDTRLLEIASLVDKPLLCFGGISSPKQIEQVLLHTKVAGVGIGNFLNYREHALQILKQCLKKCSIRPPRFQRSI